VALLFKVASSSQIKQGGIIQRHLSPHLWTSGSNRTPQEGCWSRDRTVHHTVQGCPHHSTDTPWVAHALSHFTSVRYSRIASVSAAHGATRFGDSICPICISTFKCLFIWTQPTWFLNDSGGGYHLGAPNIRSDHSPSFPCNIIHFPQIALPGLQLWQSFDHLAKPHRTSIDRKGPITSRFQPLVFYQ
jgi:hypothetical protein